MEATSKEKLVRNTAKILEPKKRRQTTRPIDRFYRCFLQDEQNGKSPYQSRGINHDQYRAGDRLSNNYYKAISYSSWDMGAPKVSYSPYRSSKLENQIQSIQEHYKAYRKLSKDAKRIIKHVCLEEFSIRDYETKQDPQLPKGKGMVFLRNSLDELVEIYRQFR